MITVTVGEQEPQEKPFPKLMISDLGQIILATGTNDEAERPDLIVGILLHSNGYNIGDNGFTKCWAASAFTDYNGHITLQNA
jgi:hypothetical protein